MEKFRNAFLHPNLLLICGLMFCLESSLHAQTLSGQGTAVRSEVLNLTNPVLTVLGDTGVLAGAHDIREASLLEGSAGSLLTANTLHATAMSWSDRVVSEASAADVLVTVAGQIISADFARAAAKAAPDTGGAGSGQVDRLVINGTPVTLTGQPNEVIPILGGRVICNEQQITAQSAVINALHIIIDGVADVVVASAKASF